MWIDVTLLFPFQHLFSGFSFLYQIHFLTLRPYELAIFFPFLRNVCLDLSILLYGYYLCHYDKVMTLLMTYQKRIYAITACLSLGTIGLYYYNTKILGLSRHYAHLVHQPCMMIYAIFMIATIFALSLHYAKNREKPSLQWLRRSVDLSSKLSFGIYLTQTALLPFLA